MNDPASVIGVHRGDDDKLYWAEGSLNSSSQLEWSRDHEFEHRNRTGSGVGLAWHNGTLFCAHPGNGDSSLWWSTWDAEARTFTEDQEFPDHHSDCTPALCSFNGNLFCVHRGKGGPWPDGDSSLYCATWNNDGGHWNGDTKFTQGSCTTGAGPALVVFGGNLYCVFRQASEDCFLYSSRFTGSGWTEGRPLKSYGSGPTSYSTPGLFVHDSKLFCIHRGRHNDTHLYTMTLKTVTNSGDPYLTEDQADAQSQNLASAGPALYQLNGTLYTLHKGDDANLWYGAYDDTTKTLLADQMIPGSLIQDEPAVVSMTAPVVRKSGVLSVLLPVTLVLVAALVIFFLTR